MSQPMIPPRPQRAQGGPTAVPQNTPQIPPRPSRKVDPSPSRESSTRSPFNEPPTAMSNGKVYGHSNLSASELPQRPPSVATLPLVGQEGLEYASYDQLPPEAHGVSDAGSTASATVQQTRHADVPMQQPTASVPLATAKDRISAVTRTDSSQAAAAGIGKPPPEETTAEPALNLRRVASRDARDERLGLSRVSSREPHPLRAESSFNRSSTSLPGGTPRPGSVHEHGEEADHGIPEIGLQVPMYRNAGDVQAPSPSPYVSQFPGGIGFFNDGSSRNHHRKRSSRQEFGPPGSYGLHGHPGQEPSDQFEREWILKHPEIAAKEGYNVYGGLAPRSATALSSDQLNRLVSENDDAGFGTSPAAIGTPSQEIGWEASEQYSSRMNSPLPGAMGELKKKRSSSNNMPAVESPLRKASITNNSVADNDDVNTIHIDGPAGRGSKVTGGGEKDNKLDLGRFGGNTPEAGGIINERGFGTPILASDEVLKRPGSAWMQPAVSPEAERTDFMDDGSRSRRNSAQQLSRPNSRPTSMHGGHSGHGFHGLHRFISHEDPHHGSGVGTPLEEIEEYEPLFSEEDEKKRAATLAEKLKKRPGLAQHHFPSQDVWEDTPASLQFTADVDTPEPEQQARAANLEQSKGASVFESPEQEQRRREQNPDDMNSDNKTFSKPHFKAGVQSEINDGRPGLNRFPSSDIWEDTPDSMRLETTVSGPQEEEIKSPPDDRPTTTGLYHEHENNDARATTGMSQIIRPQVPSRPQRSSKLAQEITNDVTSPTEQDPRQKEVPDLGVATQTSPTKTRAPSIPDRPKPVVPARPTRPSHSDQTEGAPLAKSTSRGSEDAVTSPPLPKAKPVVPARPAGNKFANLKSGFMSDLASRIGAGPTAPPKVKEPEVEAEEEKAPLADARKGRAKGPARRKPAASPSGAAAAIDAKPTTFSFTPAVTLWHIDEKDELRVPSAGAEEAHAEPELAEIEKTLSANTAKNALDVSPATNASSSVSVGPETPMEKDNPLGTPAQKAHTDTSIGHSGDIPDASISDTALERTEAVQPELEKALKSAEPAPVNAEEAQANDPSQDAEVGQGAKVAEAPGVSPLATQPPLSPESGNVVVRDGEEVARAGAD